MAELKASTIYCGDNLERLSELPDNSVDLIYADPPFFSNRHYEIIWNDGAELRAFKDRWQGGINQYVKWMRQRLMACHRVLKDTGSMYLHCDWHANAHLRIQMDNIFGANNFRNELIWEYAQSIKASSKKFLSNHDSILFYTKALQWNFTPQTTPYSKSQLARFKHQDEYGAFYYDTRRDSSNQKKRVKVYLTKDGTPVGSVWYFPHVQGEERIGYPTQKPESLLKRIIEASSNKGDMVLDPFCGCGTTIAVAHQLGRRWVGIDVSPTACRMMGERLNKLGAEVTIIGMPETIEHLKSLEPFNFQEWVINKIKGTHNNKRSSDGGVDGWTFLKHEPVQVKQSEHIGRNVIDNFETAIRRAKQNYGEIYAFSFAKGAVEEVARASLEDNITVELITIKKLLEEQP